MGKEVINIKCPFCDANQYQDWITEMEYDDEEEGSCNRCNEQFLVYRENETTFNIYKLT